MVDSFSWLLLFGVGILSGFLNVSAGGGSTLSLPLLIFLGLDATLANGTNRIAILVQNISSVAAFQKSRGYQVKTMVRYSLWTLPGAVAGALFATTVGDELFRTILGMVIIGVVITMLLPRKHLSPGDSGEEKHGSRLIYPAMLFIGFYGGFVQVGVGFLFMAALYHLMRFDLVTVNMHKVFIVLIYTVPVLAVFVFSDNVDWVLGTVLAAGSAIGGWFAAKFSLRGGEQVVKFALVAALLIMSLKLLDVI